MPAGRPPRITPALVEKIADLFFLAFSDAQVAEFTGISERTIRRARTGHFWPAIKKAEIAREIPYRKRIWDGVGNWCGAAWMLERKYPTQFAKPEIQLNYSNSYTQNTLSINLSGQEAKTIEAEAKPVREKIEGMFKAYRPQVRTGNGDENDSERF